MSLNYEPVWFDGDVLPTDAPCGSSDIGIIGGGITALSAGIDLLSQGFSVQIFESGRVISGGSSRAFGNLDVGVGQSLGQLVKWHGEEIGKAIWIESACSALELKNYIEEQSLDCDFNKSGHLKIAFTLSQQAALRCEYEDLSGYFPENGLQLLSGSELQQIWPGKKASLGFLNPLTCTINPYKFSKSLFLRFRALGGIYNANCSVSKVISSRKKILKHSKGSSSVSTLITATNGYTENVTPWLRRRIFPVGSYIIASAPLSDESLKHFTRPEQVVTTMFNFKQYMRIDSENRLLFGGRMSLSSEKDEYKVKKELITLMRRYLPFIDIVCTHVWGGKLGFTRQMMPHLGQIDSHHFYAMGYSGRGISMSWLYGKHLANMITTPRKPAPLVSSLPFQSLGSLTMLPAKNAVVSSYLRLQDRFTLMLNR